jgi:hypothetical protein
VEKKQEIGEGFGRICGKDSRTPIPVEQNQMVKTGVLKGPVEKAVREALAKEYGQAFGSERVPLGTKSNGSMATYEVDAISEDKKIIAAIYAGKRQMRGSTLNKLWKDVYFLTYIESLEAGTKVETRLLVFADEDSAESFRRRADGKYDPAVIRIVDVQLPSDVEEMRKEALK